MCVGGGVNDCPAQCKFCAVLALVVVFLACHIVLPAVIAVVGIVMIPPSTIHTLTPGCNEM